MGCKMTTPSIRQGTAVGVWLGMCHKDDHPTCLPFLLFRNIGRSALLAQGRARTPPSLSQRLGPQGCKREELEILLVLMN